MPLTVEGLEGCHSQIRRSAVGVSQTGKGIMRPNKYVRSYWLHKGIVFVAVALLLAFALTQFARYSSTVADHAAATGAMGRGGQLEKPAVW